MGASYVGADFKGTTILQPSAEQLQGIIPNKEAFLIVCIPVGQHKLVS